MTKESFEKISFLKIAKKAGISKQTVYRHFSITRDILVWYLDEQFSLFLTLVKNQSTIDSKQTVLRNSTIALSFCREQKDFLKLLLAHHLEYIFLSKIEEFVHVIAGDFGTGTSKMQQNYREKYFAGGFYMFIIYWLKTPEEISDSEIVKILSELVII